MCGLRISECKYTNFFTINLRVSEFVAIFAEIHPSLITRSMAVIYLIGYMGCGKTTLGRALGHALGARFIDLDDFVEQRAGMTVADIFAARGEQGFRRLEREALEEVARTAGQADGQLTVVGCGGGTPCQPGLMDIMLASGLTVFLQTPVWRLAERLAAAQAKRPLIASLAPDELPAFIETALASRMEHYRRAEAVFDSTCLEDEAQIEASVNKFRKQFDL